MATQLPERLIHRAGALGLFVGDPNYYAPEGGATAEERDHLNLTVVKAAIEKLDSQSN